MNRFFTLLFAASNLTAVGQFVDPYSDGLCCNPASLFFIGPGPCAATAELYYGYDIDCSDACGDCQSCNYGVVGECDYSCFEGCLFSEWFGEIGDVFWYPWDQTGWEGTYSNLLVDANQQETLEVILNVSLGDYGWDGSGNGQAQYADPISQLNYAWQLNGGEFQGLNLSWSGGNGCLWDGFQGSGFLIETQVSLIINMAQLNCDSNKVEFFEIPANAGCSATKLFDFEIEISLCGCTDSEACNFNPLANKDDGYCDYTCCPGPGCCHDGTTWDMSLQKCIVANPADTNLDGCVQLNDLLDVLSAYGDCGAEETPWACGDPLSYQGYDYATVQIGDQCWFAENLQANLYTSGDSIPGDLSNDSWAATTEGARCAYNEDNVLIAEYGQLYNLHAVLDARGLCPVGWHVPSASDFDPLAQSLGGYSVAGVAMKSSPTDSPSWNGTNTSGFNGLPGGYRDMFGMFNMLGVDGHWWTSTEYICGGRDKKLHTDYQFLNTHHGCLNHGNSVRCLQDTQ